MGERERDKGGPRNDDYMFVEKVEKMIDRIAGHKGVEGVIVCDKDGAAIQTTMDNTNTVMYAEGVRNMANIGLSMIRDVDPTNDLTFIRIGTKKLEMMAHLNPEYVAIVVQSRIKTSKN
ncbi:Dynein light chain roadblock-type 2 [Orchesella cincta]|uniref:Dynein light chain roadblock-type 2 n=2 Tax=Orchesella cincta TaxID=48709 RepID=A0A1D2N632_ORCCI|nr:Dynein light chain roadblock-type 2 [Orchesella cincta]